MLFLYSACCARVIIFNNICLTSRQAATRSVSTYTHTSYTDMHQTILSCSIRPRFALREGMSANRGCSMKTVSIPGVSLTQSARIRGEKSRNRGSSAEAIGIDYVTTNEFAQIASRFDAETVTTIFAAILGVGAGLGVPVFLVNQVIDLKCPCFVLRVVVYSKITSLTFQMVFRNCRRSGTKNAFK